VTQSVSFTPSFFNVHFNIILPTMPRSTVSSLQVYQTILIHWKKIFLLLYSPNLANHIFYVEVIPMQDLSAVVSVCIELKMMLSRNSCQITWMFLFMSINICHSSFRKLIFYFLLSFYHFSTTCFGTMLPSSGMLTLTITLLFLILKILSNIECYIFKIKKSKLWQNLYFSNKILPQK
jgi:hypothetical protein